MRRPDEDERSWWLGDQEIGAWKGVDSKAVGPFFILLVSNSNQSRLRAKNSCEPSMGRGKAITIINGTTRSRRGVGHRATVTARLREKTPQQARVGLVRWRLWFLALPIAFFLSVPLSAADENPYAAYSDSQIAELAKSWADFNADERRNFLLEMRRRMAASGKRTIPVDADARFGQVNDGVTTVTEERMIRQSVEPGRVTTESLVVRRSESGFGMGFERRVEIRGEPDEGETESDDVRPPPVDRVRTDRVRSKPPPPPRTGRSGPPPRRH